MVGKVTPYDILTGTGVPVLLGLSKFQGPNELLKSAFDSVANIEPTYNEPNEAMTWGNIMEPVIANRAALKLNLDKLNTEHTSANFHKSIPLAVSLDATAEGNGQEITTDWDNGIILMNADKLKLEGQGCLEIKLTSQEPENEPALYRGVYQLQAQMMCTGSTWGCLCVLYKGIEMRLFVYKADKDMQKTITDLALDFERRIDNYRKNQETEWYDFTNPREASSIYDEAEDTVIDIPDFESVARRVVDINTAIKTMYAEKEDCEAKIMEVMKENKTAMAGDYKIVWPTLNYKAKPEKLVPAKEAYSIRQSKLRIKQL